MLIQQTTTFPLTFLSTCLKRENPRIFIAFWSRILKICDIYDILFPIYTRRYLQHSASFIEVVQINTKKYKAGQKSYLRCLVITVSPFFPLDPSLVKLSSRAKRIST